MLTTKKKFKHQVDYEEFEVRILSKLVPNHIPVEQAMKYLEDKRVRKNKEKATNQYSEQES